MRKAEKTLMIMDTLKLLPAPESNGHSNGHLNGSMNGGSADKYGEFRDETGKFQKGNPGKPKGASRRKIITEEILARIEEKLLTKEWIADFLNSEEGKAIVLRAVLSGAFGKSPIINNTNYNVNRVSENGKPSDGDRGSLIGRLQATLSQAD